MEGRTGQSKVPVGTSPVLLSRLLPNSKRIQFAIVNTSPAQEVVYINFGAPGVDNGIPIYPGGNYVEQEDANYKPTRDDIWVVSPDATAQVNFLIRVP